MVKIGYLFPGQGAQTVGMGKDFYDNSSQARAIFDKANELVDFDLCELCFNGPEEKLTQTINAQIAIFTTSIAIHAAITEMYPDVLPALTCGLSLGEYSALVAAGILDFETALSIVIKRGALMEQAATNNPGGMISIIGLNEEQCREVAQECELDVANYNSPEQIVLSGNKDNIQRAQEVATAKGAKKGVVLNVSGAFHSQLMSNAAQGMNDVLANIVLQQPTTGFIPNVTGAFELDVKNIKELLVKQVDSSVKWTHTMQYALKQGVADYLEIGPGKVLKGLARRIDKNISVVSIDKWDALSAIETVLSKRSEV